MKRHHSLLAFLTTLALIQISACGRDPKKHSRLDGVRDNASLLLVENTFISPDEEHPKVPGSTLYYLLMSDPKKESRAYAIDCRGKNIKELAAAFGVDPSTPYPGSDSFETLEQNYKISQQPILRCSSVHPTSSNTSIHKVFQLVDDRTDEKKKEEPLPQLFVRFQNVTADDGVNQEQFYSLGCRDILNTFGTTGQNSLAEAAPILASSAARIFPDFQNYKPLNCTTNTLDPLLGKAPKKVEDLGVRLIPSVVQKNLEFYRVVDALNPEKTISYMTGQGSSYTRVLCYNIPDTEIKAALNFSPSYSTQDIKSDDSRYISSLSTPELSCVNIQTRESFENRWSTVRTNPTVTYYKKKNARTLYRFGCASAENYFTSGLNLAQNPVQLTPDVLDYLAFFPSTGYKVVTFPCRGEDLVRDPRALQVGEVISLKLPSAPADKTWLDGNTSSAGVAQLATQHSGSFWLVRSSGEEGSVRLQALGAASTFSYLACPVQGNVPQLVKQPDESGYQTKWAAYQGNGSSTVRLGCKSANGRVRFLNGGGASTLLSEEETVSDASTNWWVQHQTFVEDSNVLRPGQTVSMYSLLTPQDKRWLAAYPGANFDIGLEENSASQATRFLVESRRDSRGISLKSLNSGNGDRYLDCKPEEGKRWFELAPATDGIYSGTGYKAYKLSNSTFPIFKLACFYENTSPYWMSISGKFPWLRVDWPASRSDEYSIMYLQVWSIHT